MKTTLIAFFGALLPMLVLDGSWLLVVARQFYNTQIGGLMLDTPKILPILIFYPLYIAGLVFFVILPAIKGDTSYLSIFLTGAFFGLIAYGTYDLTNHATLKDWRLSVTLVDMAWGTFVGGLVSTISVYISRFFN